MVLSLLMPASWCNLQVDLPGPSLTRRKQGILKPRGVGVDNTFVPDIDVASDEVQKIGGDSKRGRGSSIEQAWLATHWQHGFFAGSDGKASAMRRKVGGIDG